MKTIRRRTQIDIETHEIVVIRTAPDWLAPVCERCGHRADAEHVISDDALQRFETSYPLTDLDKE